MFRGVSELSLDDKGRIAIPARHRDLLQTECQGQCVITIDTEECCLLLYPLQAWEQIEKQIEALPSFDKSARRVQRLLIGHATESQIDSHGRLLIPPPLRSYSRLQKDVVLIGQGRKFELWDAKEWNVSRDRWIQGADDLQAMSNSLLTISL